MNEQLEKLQAKISEQQKEIEELRKKVFVLTNGYDYKRINELHREMEDFDDLYGDEWESMNP